MTMLRAPSWPPARALCWARVRSVVTSALLRPTHADSCCEKTPRNEDFSTRCSSQTEKEKKTYDWRLVTIRGAFQRYKGGAKGDMMPDGRDGFWSEISPIAAPNMPPEVLQTACRRIVQLLVGCSVH